MWLITSQKNGVSALGLQRQLGLERYETAWTWLHKLRRAMVRPGRDRLSGRVEVDETFVGGEEHGVRGRETRTKSLVAVAAEEDGNGIGRIRLRGIANASAASLRPFVEDCVAPGSVIRHSGIDTSRSDGSTFRKISTTRPIGVSAFEDKLVQYALRAVLQAIYEQEFPPRVAANAPPSG